MILESPKKVDNSIRWFLLEIHIFISEDEQYSCSVKLRCQGSLDNIIPLSKAGDGLMADRTLFQRFVEKHNLRVVLQGDIYIFFFSWSLRCDFASLN